MLTAAFDHADANIYNIICAQVSHTNSSVWRMENGERYKMANGMD